MLIILCQKFKVGLRMSACGADLRCFGSYYDVSAIAAFPYLYFAFLKNLCCLYILQQCAVALLMTLLNGSHKAEFGSQFLKTFFFRCLCKTVIHVCPLIVLAFGCIQQVLCCGADAVVQFLEPQLCVFLLIVGSLLEESGNLFETIFLC